MGFEKKKLYLFNPFTATMIIPMLHVNFIINYFYIFLCYYFFLYFNTDIYISIVPCVKVKNKSLLTEILKVETLYQGIPKYSTFKHSLIVI